MSFSRIYHTNHVAQISVPGTSKFKSRSAISKAMRHNERIGNEGKGRHIDTRRSHLNRSLIDNASKDIYLDIVNRLTGNEYTKDTVPEYGRDTIRYQDGKKIRQGSEQEYCAVLAFEAEMRYPGDMVWSTFDGNGKVRPVPEGTEIDENAIRSVEEGGKGYFLMPVDKKEFTEWCHSTADFLKKRFGEQNVMSMTLHMDEGEPHIHGIITPIFKDKNGTEKLSYRNFLGTKSDMFELQTSYSDSLRHLGYKRGELASIRGIGLSTKEYKAKMIKAIESDLPETLSDAHDQIRTLRARNFELEESNKRLNASAKTIQNLRIRNEELRRDMEKVNQQLEAQKAELNRIRLLAEIEENKRRCEKKGLEIHPSQDIVTPYIAFQEQVTKMGEQYYKEIGLPMQLKYYEDINHDGIYDRLQTIDEDHNGIDDRNE